jgi:cysteine desulfurase
MTVFGANAPRLPNTSLFAVPGMASDTQVIALDLAGVAVSAGAACSSGKVHASHVLKSMGVSDDLATTAIRVSLGWSTEQTDVDRFLDAWYEIRVTSISDDATEMQKAS